MAEYQIAHFKKENERAIKKKTENEELRLSVDHGELVWTPKKARAKRFFHQDAVESALVTIKMKGGVKEREPYRPEQPAQSWGEFSSD